MTIRRFFLMLAPLALCGLLSACSGLFFSEKTWLDGSEGFPRNKHFFRYEIDDMYGHIRGADMYRSIDKCTYGYHGEDHCIMIGSRKVSAYEEWGIVCSGLNTLECWVNVDMTNFSIYARKGELVTICAWRNDQGIPSKLWLNGQQWELKPGLTAVKNLARWGLEFHVCLDEADMKDFMAATRTGGTIIFDYAYKDTKGMAYSRQKTEVDSMYRETIDLLLYISTMPKMNERAARIWKNANSPVCSAHVVRAPRKKRTIKVSLSAPEFPLI